MKVFILIVLFSFSFYSNLRAENLEDRIRKLEEEIKKQQEVLKRQQKILEDLRNEAKREKEAA